MITITCEACKKESNNPYEFNNKRFHYVDEHQVLKVVHLCDSCQMQLFEQKEDTIAKFLGVRRVSGWTEGSISL